MYMHVYVYQVSEHKNTNTCTYILYFWCIIHIHVHAVYYIYYELCIKLYLITCHMCMLLSKKLLSSCWYRSNQNREIKCLNVSKNTWKVPVRLLCCHEKYTMPKPWCHALRYKRGLSKKFVDDNIVFLLF